MENEDFEKPMIIVRCVTTGEVFYTLADAEKKYGYHRGTLLDRILQNKFIDKLIWEIEDQGVYLDDRIEIKHSSCAIGTKRCHGRKVIVRELGLTFDTITLAAKYFKVSITAVWRSIYKGYKCQGLSFELLDKS